MTHPPIDGNASIDPFPVPLETFAWLASGLKAEET